MTRTSENYLINDYPLIAARMVDSDLAKVISSGSNKKVEWCCERGHNWSAVVFEVVKSKTGGCPYCSNRKVLAGFNDFATTDPVIASELVDAEDGRKFTRGSTKKVSWRCTNKHEWTATIGSRISGGNGCPTCSGHSVDGGITDLATTHPELAKQLVDQSLATQIGPGHTHAVEWQCGNGHTWNAVVHSRVGGNGCPKCSGRGPIGENRLSTTHPLLTAELVDRSVADRVRAGNGMKVEWQCASGHRWMATVVARVGGSGCPQCSGRRITQGINDLATTHPEVALKLVDRSLAAGLSKGSSVRADWLCDAGHVWQTIPGKIIAGSGCPTCCLIGFRNDSSDARLYLVLPNDSSHPMGYGKVQSKDRHNAAMSGPYEQCAQLAYAVGVGRCVSDAEEDLNALTGRPKGTMPRLVRESLDRTLDSIQAWVDAAERHGLEIHWVVPRDSITLNPPGTKKPRVHAERTVCGCTMDGVSRHDSTSDCCKQARKDATTLVAGGHYLGSLPRSTVHFFTWRVKGEIKAVMTLGTGASSNAAASLSGKSGLNALELTRLWASPDLDISLSSFVGKCFDLIKYPLYVYSYADADEGHTGGIYRACSFNYSGWSDMTRPIKLRRQPSRKSYTPFSEWKDISAKHRYWKLIGVKGKRRSDSLAAAMWTCYDPKILGYAPPLIHRRTTKDELSLATVQPR